MRPRSWLLTTIVTMALAAAAIAAVNAELDIYGLYRPTPGRHLLVYGDTRIAKYLLSVRYVPENFNAILAGASISANWDVTAIDGLRVYNESLNGGNVVEEKAVMEAALERPGISVAFLLVHPAMTYSHEFHTVRMDSELKRSALGSISLFDAYRDMAKIRIGRIPQVFDYAGTETFSQGTSEMNPFMKKMWSAKDFAVDPVALQAQRDLIADLRAHRVQIVFIVPPTSEALLMTKGEPLERYMRAMRSEIGAENLWIDLSSPEYEDFRSNPANFSDGVHLTTGGAKLVVGYISTATSRWIAERRLVVGPR